MSYKEYAKWLAVGFFGFMGLSWDAMFFIRFDSYTPAYCYCGKKSCII